MKLLGSIYIAIAILVLTTAIGWYVDIHNEQMHERHLTVHTQLERMARLQQELNGMLSTAVLEENTLRASTYDRVGTDLDSTLQSVKQLTATLGLSDEITVVQADHDKLRTIEAHAIAAMRQEQWLQARRLLFDDDYLLTKKLYEINSETAVGALTAELGAQAQRFAKARTAALGLRVGAVLLLIGVSVVFSRRLREELRERERLGQEIQAANAMLEDSVRKRTAELEAANHQLATLSTTDSLTGLANRRKFDEVWQTEWQRATRQGTPLAVIMLDVDFFKRYNDHDGHQAGDVCLQQVAHILSGGIHRAGELVARYGGEEFVLVLPGADIADAYASAERIRVAVQAAAIAHADSPLGPVVTVSVGLAAGIPRIGTHPEHLLRAADAALYRAKAQGRNCCCLSPADLA
ncbi:MULTISPECIES: GGDEF domain-containing protein [Giesbergeria]|uniref:diguanylate cyclase n=1 Tax=Giesbergeria sinuosa TaxID=80883 RepID=A0ABV9QD46_9BURK